MADGAVLRTETVDGRPQAARTRPVEIGDLNYAHKLNENRHVCAISDASSTGVLTAREQRSLGTGSGTLRQSERCASDDFRPAGNPFAPQPAGGGMIGGASGGAGVGSAAGSGRLSPRPSGMFVPGGGAVPGSG